MVGIDKKVESILNDLLSVGFVFKCPEPALS